MVKIYKQPFAHDGDTIAIPDASQPDGKISSADGWTPDYQLPRTDPNYKPVGRQEMNGVFKEVTEALGQVQVQGAASWSPDGAPYPVNAQVYHNGKQWIALHANSVEPVEGADWTEFGASVINGKLDKSSVLQSLGQSTTDVVSQKAVTDAVAMPEITGSCTTNGTTDNTLVLTGIVPALALEVGDVIQITGSTDGLNDKLFTVESITDDNSIIVNYEHAGNRGDGSLRLEDETAIVTITRIAKWYNAPLGLGQAWVDLYVSRSANTYYTINPFRATAAQLATLNHTKAYISATGGGGTMQANWANSNNSDGDTTLIIPPGHYYMITTKGGDAGNDVWSELR